MRLLGKDKRPFWVCDPRTEIVPSMGWALSGYVWKGGGRRKEMVSGVGWVRIGSAASCALSQEIVPRSLQRQLIENNVLYEFDDEI